VLVGFAALIGIIAATTYTDSPRYRRPGFQKITMDHVFNGTFYAEHKDIHWVPEGKAVSFVMCYSRNISRVAGDGVYSVFEDEYIKLVDLKNNSTKNLVSARDVRDVGILLMKTRDNAQSTRTGKRKPPLLVSVEHIS